MSIQANYQRWLNSSKLSPKMKKELQNLSPEEIDDAFFKDVEFGTAGMRGVLGPGTNRLNEFTVRKATVGFAIYLLEKYPHVKDDGVVISHDNRHMSREFTLLSAQVLNDFGIKTYIFDSLRPTPELSFAVRYLKASGGIMITASHNPKEYNGYKVYDETGCQLVPDKIARLVEIIASLPNELDVSYVPENHKGETIVLNNEIDDAYVKAVEDIEINGDLDKSNFKIVFTPNHGTSYVNAMRIFKDLGYNVIPVLSQCTPDPDFSNTLSPNPEDAKSFIEPLKLAREVKAKLVVMTDPDGDRVGLAGLTKDGDYQLFTGNQSAAMLMDYIFSQRQKKNHLHKDGVMYNTVVTSPLGEKVASSYGIRTEQFLTGFKYIGSRIDHYDHVGGATFEFGYEESYGCLVKDFARDKDGCQAILLYCEMALFYDLQGKTLDIVWDELQQRFGYHQDIVYSIYFKGSSGQAQMDALMDEMHTHPLKELNGNPVIKVEDYLTQERKQGADVSKIDLPKSNLIRLTFENGNVICVRPSGTEPKVKFYISVITKEKADKSSADELFKQLKQKYNIE